MDVDALAVHVPQPALRVVVVTPGSAGTSGAFLRLPLSGMNRNPSRIEALLEAATSVYPIWGAQPGHCPPLYTWPVRDVDALAADLHARGLRVTPQRQLIYSLLAEKPGHPTVEAVHEAVRKVLPTVSLRTVYQALHDLEAMGEIRLVQVGNGPLRVDTTLERHAHLRCTGCGRLHDVDVDLSELALPVAQRRGFAVEGAEVIFSGRCPMCADDPQSDPQGE